MIPSYVVTLSVIAWLMPPFKQQRTEYFLFFLILAFADPLMLLFFYLRLFPVEHLYVVVELLVIYSLIKKNNLNRIIILAAGVAYVFLYKSVGFDAAFLLGAALHTVILLIVVYRFLLHTKNRKMLSLFYILLICYELSVILKMLAVVVDIKSGVTQFYLVSFLQITFGILFTIFNVNSKDFRLVKRMEEV